MHPDSVLASPAPEVATVSAPGDWEGLTDGEADSQATRELLRSVDAQRKGTAVVIPPLFSLCDAALTTEIGVGTASRRAPSLPMRKVNRECTAVGIGSADRSFGVQTVAAAGNVPLDVVLTPRIGSNRCHSVAICIPDALRQNFLLRAACAYISILATPKRPSDTFG